MIFTQLNQRKEFYSNLGKLLHSGISMNDALKTVGSRSKQEEITLYMIQGIDSGKNIGQIFDEFPDFFPLHERKLISVYSQCGRLPELFMNMANDIDQFIHFVNKIIGRLTYPFVLMNVSYLFFPLMNIIKGGSTPMMFYLFPLIIFYLSFLLLIKAVISDDKFRQTLCARFSLYPFIGSIIVKQQSEKVIRCYMHLQSAGISVTESLSTCLQISSLKQIKRSLKLAKSSVEKGGTHTEGIRVSKLFPESLIKRWEVGVMSGREVEALHEISNELRGEKEIALEKFGKALTRTIYFIAVLSACYSIFSMAAGHLQTLNEISDL